MSATATVARRREELTEVEAQHAYAAHHYSARTATPTRTRPARPTGAPRHTSPFEEGSAPTEGEVELLRRLLEDEPATLSHEEVTAEALRARRRARKSHRPFRLTLTQWGVAGLLLLQLTGMLWWQSRALALRNYEMRLRDKIALTGQQVAQTKHSISQLDSKGNLAHTAAQLGWQEAPVNSLDDITNSRRITPEEAAVLGNPAPQQGNAAVIAPETAAPMPPQKVDDAPRVVITAQSGDTAPSADVIPLSKETATLGVANGEGRSGGDE